MLRTRNLFLRILVVSILSLPLASTSLFADLDAAEKAQDKAKKEFGEEFLKFTLERNVEGKAKTVDGKIVLQGDKTRFDGDDGRSYRSPLTQHDFSYKEKDQAFSQKNKNNPNPNGRNTRTMLANISHHGAVSSAGGSSELERAGYEENDKYDNQQAQAQQSNTPPPKQKGIRNEGAFIIETKEILKKDIQGAAPPPSPTPGATPNPQDDKIEVNRDTFQKDSQKRFEDIGTNSGVAVVAAAKEKGKETDPNLLSNLTLLFEGAYRGYEGWWNSTLANLAQGNINKATDGDGRINEDAPTCEAGAKQSFEDQIKKASSPQRKADLEKQMKELIDQCKAVAKLDYKTINPEFEKDAKGNKKLKTGNLAEEEGRARDNRNQLEILATGKSVKKLKGNWQYDEKEDKAKVVREYDEETGQAKEAVDMTIKEQLEDYNAQIDEAADAFKEVKKKLGTLQIDEEQIRNFKYDTEGDIPIAEIVKQGRDRLMESETGIPTPEDKQQGFAQNYEELLERAKQ